MDIMKLERYPVEFDIECVYILWKNKKPYYVGQTRNLKVRLQRHKSDKNWSHFSFIEKHTIAGRARLEARLIRKLKPLCNEFSGEVYYGGTKSTERRKAVGELLSRFGPMSCRQIKRLLLIHFDIQANHNTVNSDMKVMSRGSYAE